MKKKSNTSNWSKAGKIIIKVGKTLIVVVPVVLSVFGKGRPK